MGLKRKSRKSRAKLKELKYNNPYTMKMTFLSACIYYDVGLFVYIAFYITIIV